MQKNLVLSLILMFFLNLNLFSNENEKAKKIFEEYHQLNLKLYPNNATYFEDVYNIPKFDDASFKHWKVIKKSLKKFKRYAKRTVKEKKLDRVTKIYFDILMREIDKGVSFYKYRYLHHLFDHMWGPHSSLPETFQTYQQIKNKDDIKAYLSKIKDSYNMFKVLTDETMKQASKGVILPLHSLEKVELTTINVMDQFEGKLFNENNLIYKDFVNKVNKVEGLLEVEKKEFFKTAKDYLFTYTLDGYKYFLNGLQDLKSRASSEIGVWQYPKGNKYYKFNLKFHTTLDLTPEEVHQIGLDEVDRIHNEIREIMKKVSFSGTLEDFFKFTRTDKQFYYSNNEQGRKAYMRDATALINKMKLKLKDLFFELPDIDLEVTPVPEYAQESAGLAYYQRPSDDGVRPGKYFVNLKDMSELPKFEMEALAYHEGVPGHHLQSIHEIKTRKDVPKFMKGVWFTAHGEGWGLYSEYLPKEYGFYEDPYSDYGRLTMELWRATRLVLDTGIHHKKWDRLKSIQYLNDNTPAPQSANETAIDRYTVWPGQATGYLIGKNKILELREKAKAALGDKFDIKKFHDIVLKYGGIPLNVLEELINEYIESNQS